MRGARIAALVLALVLALSLWTGAALRRRCGQWTEYLALAEDRCRADDLTGARQALESLRLSWQAAQPWLRMLCWHSDLYAFSAALAGAEAALEDGDPAQFRQALAQLSAAADAMAAETRPDWGNIL